MSRRKTGERWSRSFTMVHVVAGDVRRTLDSGLSDLSMAAEEDSADHPEPQNNRQRGNDHLTVAARFH